MEEEKIYLVNVLKPYSEKEKPTDAQMDVVDNEKLLMQCKHCGSEEYATLSDDYTISKSSFYCSNCNGK